MNPDRGVDDEEGGPRNEPGIELGVVPEKNFDRGAELVVTSGVTGGIDVEAVKERTHGFTVIEEDVDDDGLAGSLKSSFFFFFCKEDEK